MKILLTGANGFVGSCVYKKLLKQGFEIIPLVLESVGFDNEIIIDFTDPDFVSKINKLPSVDVVIHFASLVDFSIGRESLFVTNVLATAELARWAKQYGSFFVFSSSVVVCGVNSSIIKQDMPENLDTDYGYSKWLAEKMIRMSGVENLILRISGVFGNNGPSHLGINNAITEAIKGKIPELKGDGLSKRNYIYIEDLAELIIDAIQRKVLGIHLVGGHEPITIKQMLDEICQVFLSGNQPQFRSADNKSRDQIVEPSKELLKGRKFIEALYDIREKTKCK